MSQPSRTATQWLSARQVADELGLKPETVARHLAAGKIRAPRVSGDDP